MQRKHEKYESYLETMRAYNFYPLDYKTWLSWEIGMPLWLLKPTTEPLKMPYETE